MAGRMGSEPTPLIPALRRFYEFNIDFSWLVVRFGVAWLLIVHAYGKMMRGMPGQAKVLDASVPYFKDFNLELAYLLTFVEGVGGICILLGLFTRFFAVAVGIEMAFLTFWLYWSTGYSWLNRGYEFTLLWGLMCAAIALRGGGPYSIDRLIGKEL